MEFVSPSTCKEEKKGVVGRSGLKKWIREIRDIWCRFTKVEVSVDLLPATMTTSQKTGINKTTQCGIHGDEPFGALE